MEFRAGVLFAALVVAACLVVSACFIGCGDQAGLDITTPQPGDGDGDGDGGTGAQTTGSIAIDRDDSGPFELPNDGGTVVVTATVTATEGTTVSEVQATFMLGTAVAQTVALSAGATGAYSGQVVLARNGDFSRPQTYTVVASARVGETVVTSGSYSVTVAAPDPPPAEFQP